MTIMTPEEIEEQNRLHAKFYQELRDLMIRYDGKLLPEHVFGSLLTIQHAYSHMQHDRALKKLLDGLEGGR